MLMTTKQVADKLNISTHTVRTWHKEGKFTGIENGKGTKKKHYLFHSKSVNEFAKTMKPNNRASKKDNSITAPVSSNGILTRLDNIESKLDKLIKLWS